MASGQQQGQRRWQRHWSHGPWRGSLRLPCHDAALVSGSGAAVPLRPCSKPFPPSQACFCFVAFRYLNMPHVIVLAVLAALTAARLAASTAAAAAAASVPPSAAPCPCADPALCKPVQTIHQREVFGFSVDRSTPYDR